MLSGFDSREGVALGLGLFLNRAPAFATEPVQDVRGSQRCLLDVQDCLPPLESVGGAGHVSSKQLFPAHYHELNVFLL